MPTFSLKNMVGLVRFVADDPVVRARETRLRGVAVSVALPEAAGSQSDGSSASQNTRAAIALDSRCGGPSLKLQGREVARGVDRLHSKLVGRITRVVDIVWGNSKMIAKCEYDGFKYSI